MSAYERKITRKGRHSMLEYTTVLNSEPFVRYSQVDLRILYVRFLGLIEKKKTHIHPTVETWFHQILYQRQLYPPSIFELKKKFDIPVHIAEHPGVQQYLAQFISSCFPLLEKVTTVKNRMKFMQKKK